MHDEIAEVFRTEWTRLVAILLRDLGDLGTAEDAAQDAFIEASQRWPTDGFPDRPGAWLLTTARRRGIDRIRRTRRLDALIPIIGEEAIERSGRSGDPTHDVAHLDDPALDEQLALLVGCCHPALSHDAQIALTLRIVGGLSTAQIARAFLVGEETMTRRLTRSKTKVRDARIPFTPPTIETLAERLPAVCNVIYSIFTEGHTSARSAELVRGDLCDEARWLAELLGTLVPDDPEVAGLHALLLLTDARRASRTDDDGAIVLLADQDRSRWDRQQIASGLALLARAHAGGRAGMFQFQAAVAAIHATAPSFEQTDWTAIVRLYDVMLARQPTKLVALNRAIALAQVEGPAPALAQLDAIAVDDTLRGDLDDYPYFHTTRAEFLVDLDRPDDALEAFRRAIEACENDAERRHLEQRVARVSARRSRPPS